LWQTLTKEIQEQGVPQQQLSQKMQVLNQTQFEEDDEKAAKTFFRQFKKNRDSKLADQTKA
jgi:hypothetical protein